jgi:selenocysteine lyase/cysteine desulfurase
VIDAVADVYASCNVNTHGNFPPSAEVDRRMQVRAKCSPPFLGAEGRKLHLLRSEHDHAELRLSAAIGHTLKARRRGAHHAARSRGESRPVATTAKEQASSCNEVRCSDSGQLDAADMAAKITRAPRCSHSAPPRMRLGTVNDIALARRLTATSARFWWSTRCTTRRIFRWTCTAMDTDFLLCSAYKFYGPHVGVLYSRPGALNADCRPIG